MRAVCRGDDQHAGAGALSDALPADSRVAVGFGIGYPIGVCAVVLFVQLVPRLLGERLDADQDTEKGTSESAEIVRSLIEVCNPAMVDKRPGSVTAIANSSCQVSRVLRDDRLQPIGPDFAFAVGQRVLVVGTAEHMATVIDMLGRQVAEFDVPLDSERQRKSIVVTSEKVVGSSLRNCSCCHATE